MKDQIIVMLILIKLLIMYRISAGLLLSAV